jgi:hypothetical protein
MNATITDLPAGVFQSRWGFHPIGGNDFQKIKLLHKHYWIAKRRVAAHARWNRKLPKNRVIRKENKTKLEKPIPIPEPWCPKVYRDIITKPIVPLYQQARHPQSDPRAVKPLAISVSQVELWLAEIEKAYQTK